MAITLIRAVWVVVAILLGLGAFAGGDTAVLCGWLQLVWTFPIGVAWWFYFERFFWPLVDRNVLQVSGMVLVIVVAYWFWFVLIPTVVRKARPKTHTQTNAL
jgi:hypothetical protein